MINLHCRCAIMCGPFGENLAKAGERESTSPSSYKNIRKDAVQPTNVRLVPSS